MFLSCSEIPKLMVFVGVVGRGLLRAYTFRVS